MTAVNVQCSYRQKTWITLSMFFITIIFAWFPTVANAEKITDYSTAITINQNAYINVSEIIHYDFEGESRHGIYRDIPIKNSDGSLLSINIESVIDEHGSNYPFSKETQGNNLRLKIGDPSMLVTGQKEYHIIYDVKNAFVSFPDYDELYWNTIGTAWPVSIDHSVVTVISTNDVPGSILQSSCYQGSQKSKRTCSISHSNEYSITTALADNLSVHEGMTIAIGYKKGTFTNITRIGNQINMANETSVLHKSNLFEKITLVLFGLGIISAALLYRYRWFVDPKPRNPVVAWYEPPVGLPPLIIGTMIDKNTDTRDLVGQILSLAQRGYLSITRTEIKKMLVFKDVDYSIEVIKDTSDITWFGDQMILEMLFGSKQPNFGATVLLSYLSKTKGAYYTSMLLKEDAKKYLVDQGYFTKTKLIFITIVVQVVLLIIVYSLFTLIKQNTVDLLFGFGTMTCIVISMFIVRLHDNQYTQFGIDTKQETLGFKNFLSVTDKERFDFHNSPEKNPTQFMEYLPYAVALGVSKKWAEQFKDINIPNPDWYHGNTTNAFIATQFISEVSTFQTAFTTAAIPASSGSGGGGFSGGGSGGGGGGSW